MKKPRTTKEEPYIEFRVKNGIVILKKTRHWWGKDGGFISSTGESGNSCKPEDLEAYFEAYKKRQIKDINKQIIALKAKAIVLENTFIN